MKTFDRAFGQEVLTRLGRLPEDAIPLWGTMNRGQVIGHLDMVLHYTLGEKPELPFRGNFKTRHIFRHIILFGLKDIPHNVRAPIPKGITKQQMFPEVPLETLATSIDTYLASTADGGLPARMHPYFGPLTAAQWKRFHRLHFTHHLRQFGVGDGL